MELERHQIERKDFPAARRGYDPDEVDRHLREIADSVGELKRTANRPAREPGGLAGAAAEQVRTIVEAAERSAAQIEEKADQESRRITREAEEAARETREKADADAAEHVRRVEDATRGMVERAAAIDREIDSLLSGLRETTNAVVESLRSSADALSKEVREAGSSLTGSVKSSAGSLASDLEAIRTGLGDVREARGGGIAAEPVAAAAAGEPAGIEPEEILDEEPEAEAVAVPDEPEPDALEDEEEPAEDETYGEGDEDFASEVPADEALDRGATVMAQQPAAAEPGATIAGGEGARLIALNMALNGTPREETAKYLAENFDLPDQDAILDDVYSRAGQG